jgi:acyl-CoA synthetase (AMP-forming)/AMP-acid ligase II
MQLLTDFLQPGKIFFRKKIYEPDTVLAGIDSVARYLKDNLVSDSPFVYLFASNHIKTALAYFGIIKARRICVIMDPKIGRLELAEMLQDTPPAACIRIDMGTETFDFSKEIEIRKQPWKDDPNQDLSDVCTMIYTNAEDGYAKAAMLTHENMLSNAKAVALVDELSDLTVSFSMMNFSHLFSVQVGIIAPFICKGSIVVKDVSDLTRMMAFCDIVHDVNVTNLYSVPFVFYLLCKVTNIGRKIISVESFVSGGYKLSEDIFQRFFKKTGKEIHEGYGLSEVSPICTCHRREDRIIIRSVGRSFPCCEIKIMNGNEIQNDQSGEINIKGSNVMKGYFKGKNIHDTITSGWLRTGDLGFLNNEGYLFLTGLRKRMINYGGQKVYPAEVERLMKTNSNLLDVKVYGTIDNLSGQKVEAKINLKENTFEKQKEFHEWCHRNITNYKIYSRVEFDS